MSLRNGHQLILARIKELIGRDSQCCRNVFKPALGRHTTTLCQADCVTSTTATISLKSLGIVHDGRGRIQSTDVRGKTNRNGSGKTGSVFAETYSAVRGVSSSSSITKPALMRAVTISPRE